MVVQFNPSGTVLFDNGSVAMHEDCCCCKNERPAAIQISPQIEMEYSDCCTDCEGDCNILFGDFICNYLFTAAGKHLYQYSDFIGVTCICACGYEAYGAIEINISITDTVDDCCSNPCEMAVEITITSFAAGMPDYCGTSAVGYILAKWSGTAQFNPAVLTSLDICGNGGCIGAATCNRTGDCPPTVSLIALYN